VAAVKVTVPAAEPFVVVSGVTLKVTEVIDCAVEFEALEMTLAYALVGERMDTRARRIAPGKYLPRVLFISSCPPFKRS
jgi:hypothetical protein